jgi:hypothetical protein
VTAITIVENLKNQLLGSIRFSCQINQASIGNNSSVTAGLNIEAIPKVQSPKNRKTLEVFVFFESPNLIKPKANTESEKEVASRHN